jgi:hypothetical protein
MTSPARKHGTKWWQTAILVPLVPLVLAIGLVWLLLFFLAGICLRILIWSCWCPRGRYILFVYSDSPIWHDYIEQHILPHLGQRALVLNWSDRKRWRLSLARMAFHRFGGYREFNPLAVVFRPVGRTRIFRFWKPFQDFKHGHPEALQKMESEFFGLIGVQRRGSSA